MNDEEKKKLMQDALDKWGYHSQMFVWVEELNELSKALVKHERKWNATSRADIEDEIADVQVVLEQMKLVYPKWKERFEFKLNRFKSYVYDEGNY